MFLRVAEGAGPQGRHQPAQAAGGGGTGKMLFFFSFTGSRGSFHGDLNFYGKNGAAFYTQYKTVTSNWRFSASDGMSGLHGVGASR